MFTGKKDLMRYVTCVIFFVTLSKTLNFDYTISPFLFTYFG